MSAVEPVPFTGDDLTRADAIDAAIKYAVDWHDIGHGEISDHDRQVIVRAIMDVLAQEVAL